MLSTGYRTVLTHESSGEVGVCADLAVDLNQPLHDDLGHLSVGQGVLQTVAQEDHQRQRLAQLVWALGRPGSEHASQLVQHPRLGRIQALQMLLGSSSLKTTQKVEVMLLHRSCNHFVLLSPR